MPSLWLRPGAEQLNDAGGWQISLGLSEVKYAESQKKGWPAGAIRNREL